VTRSERLREKEHELIRLGERFAEHKAKGDLASAAVVRAEYRRKHKRWVDEKNQGSLDV